MKKVLANLLLYGLAGLLLFPDLGARAGTLTLPELIPFIPLCLYAALGLFHWDLFVTVPRDAVQTLAVTYQAMSLTLSGFCFTSIGFLLAFFKDEIKKSNELNPEAILYYFAIALGCFLTSYMTLRFRHRQIFIVLFNALIDNGLWCIVVGFLSLTMMIPKLHRLTVVFGTLAAIFLIYVGIHIIYSLKFSNPQRPGQ
jgi:hypothetical protein